MTRNELYELMDDTSLLTDKTLPELQQLVRDFPYFHAARMLYLNNLAVCNDIRTDVVLAKTAIHIPDRMRLFMLLENKQHIPDHKADKAKSSKFDMIDEFLKQTGNDTGTDELIYDAPPADYISPREGEESESLGQMTDFVRKKDAPAPIKNIMHDDSYFTETLAIIYIRQKRYEKALEIIKKINLQYPNKSRYFADQIRFLEKLINNKK